MQSCSHSPRFGALMMLCAALCFSTGGLLCKLIPWSALAINGARNLIACVVIGLYLLLRRHPLRWNRTILLGSICCFGVTTFFIMANKMTTAANAIVLQYSAPIWVMLFMALRLHQRPTKADFITMAAVFIGILCFFFDSFGSGSLLGNLTALLSGLFYAVMFLLNSLEGGDSLSSLFFGQLFGGLLLLPTVAQETDFSPRTLAFVLVLGVVQVGFAYIFFSEGTAITPPITASLITGIEPVLNPILVAVFWGEFLSPLSFVGATLVIVTILLYNLYKSRSSVVVPSAP